MPLAGRLTDRLGAGRVVPVGLLLALLGTAAYTQVGADTSYLLLGGALFVRGLGLGATMMPTMSSAYVRLRREAVPRATSTISVMQRVGGSFGSALMAIVLSRAITERLPGGAGGGGSISSIPPQIREQVAPVLAEAFGQSFWVALALMVPIIVPVLFLPRRGTAAPGGDTGTPRETEQPPVA